ncbi:hypothetical protein [Paracoccus yeei]|uniref:Uncharacterized protein n=1 Tax=Paracoccus yeei TaxID=147645 RepID=A0A5P2QSH8_9RHOB|nr:hypothetical protein [Paracoccus yeei]QEU08750.1 hypothetical protein FOB51_12530 [Paracoccus yeei]
MSSTPEHQTPNLRADAIALAVSLISRHGPYTFTSNAALRMLATVLPDVPYTALDLQEDHASLDRLADLCRDVIRTDPDGSSKWVMALSQITRRLEKATDPENWSVSETMSRRARAAMGEPDRTDIVVSFDAAGNLVARRPEDAESQVVVARVTGLTS